MAECQEQDWFKEIVRRLKIEKIIAQPIEHEFLPVLSTSLTPAVPQQPYEVGAIIFSLQVGIPTMEAVN